jgi:preprotein translocase subunit SecG
MESLIIVVHVIVAIGITGLVLIQQGKGADMGASFGSGASQTIFGSVGSGNALTKSTSWLATVFFVTSLVLALYAKQQAAQGIQAESLIQNPDQLPATFVAPPQQDIPVLSVEPVASDIPLVEDAVLQAAAQEALDTAVEEAGQAADTFEETVQELPDGAAN